MGRWSGARVPWAGSPQPCLRKSRQRELHIKLTDGDEHECTTQAGRWHQPGAAQRASDCATPGAGADHDRRSQATGHWRSAPCAGTCWRTQCGCHSSRRHGFWCFVRLWRALLDAARGSPRSRGTSLHALSHGGDVLADAGCIADRPEPSFSRYGVGNELRSQSPGLRCDDSADGGHDREGVDVQRIRHRRIRQDARDAASRDHAGGSV